MMHSQSSNVLQSSHKSPNGKRRANNFNQTSQLNKSPKSMLQMNMPQFKSTVTLPQGQFNYQKNLQGQLRTKVGVSPKQKLTNATSASKMKNGSLMSSLQSTKKQIATGHISESKRSPIRSTSGGAGQRYQKSSSSKLLNQSNFQKQNMNFIQDATMKSSQIESQIQQVLDTAQTKLTDLDAEIDQLENENDQLVKEIDKASQTKKSIQDDNRGLQNDLKGAKNNNKELIKEKQNLEYQLRKMRDELQMQINKAEKRKQAIWKKIQQLQSQEVKITLTKEQERKQFQDQHEQNLTKVMILSKELEQREMQVEAMKLTLEQINMKDSKNLKKFNQKTQKQTQMM